MKTLVLGHGRKYEINNIGCSPCPVMNWFYNDYTCVDIDPDVEPDIVFDLKRTIWIFCLKNENKYDMIIDTGGLAFYYRGYSPSFKKNITLTLNENGLFYGRNTLWKKINGELIDISNV